MNDLLRILNMAVRMDAHDSRKARDIFEGRLRELMSEQQKQIADEVVADYRDDLLTRREGAELQRGLEAAVERERERLDGPDDEQR